MCNFFAFIKWLLPVLRLTVAMVGDSLRLAEKKILLSRVCTVVHYAVLEAIHAVYGLDDLCQGRPSKVNDCLKAKATNFGCVKAKD